MGAPAPERRTSRQGLSEYVLVTAFLALAAAGVIAIWGDEIRSAFGARATPAAPSTSAANRVDAR